MTMINGHIYGPGMYFFLGISGLPKQDAITQENIINIMKPDTVNGMFASIPPEDVYVIEIPADVHESIIAELNKQPDRHEFFKIMLGYAPQVPEEHCKKIYAHYYGHYYNVGKDYTSAGLVFVKESEITSKYLDKTLREYQSQNIKRYDLGSNKIKMEEESHAE